MRKHPMAAIRGIARRLDNLDIEALSFDHDLAKQHRAALFDIADKAMKIAIAIETTPEHKTDRAAYDYQAAIESRAETDKQCRLGGIRALTLASEPRTITVKSEVVEVPLATFRVKTGD